MSNDRIDDSNGDHTEREHLGLNQEQWDALCEVRRAIRNVANTPGLSGVFTLTYKADPADKSAQMGSMFGDVRISMSMLEEAIQQMNNQRVKVLSDLLQNGSATVLPITVNPETGEFEVDNTVDVSQLTESIIDAGNHFTEVAEENAIDDGLPAFDRIDKKVEKIAKSSLAGSIAHTKLMDIGRLLANDRHEEAKEMASTCQMSDEMAEMIKIMLSIPNTCERPDCPGCQVKQTLLERADAHLNMMH